MATTFTISAPRLRQALQTASAFMSDDYALPTLAGAHMAPAGDQVAFTATDRYIASYETLKIEGEAFTANIPGRVVASLIAVLTPIDVDDYDEDGPVPPIEPFDMATFVLADDGKVTVRLVGLDEIEHRFTPATMKFPNIPLIIEQAEAAAAEPLAGVHFTARVLATALEALRQRDGGLLEVVAAAEGKPLVIRQGDNFRALIMSVKVSDG